MRYLIFVIIVLCLMTACSTKPDNTLSPVKVVIEKTADGYQLLRGGEPYAVKGAGMVVDDIERFVAGIRSGPRTRRSKVRTRGRCWTRRTRTALRLRSVCR